MRHMSFITGQEHKLSAVALVNHIAHNRHDQTVRTGISQLQTVQKSSEIFTTKVLLPQAILSDHSCRELSNR